MGASGVQMGSRFAASEESNGAPQLKEFYLKMTKDDVIQIDSPVGFKVAPSSVRFQGCLGRASAKAAYL